MKLYGFVKLLKNIFYRYKHILIKSNHLSKNIAEVDTKNRHFALRKT